jgi:hypothetical protein
MSQIKDKEQAKERGEWNAMTPEQRQEADMGLKKPRMEKLAEKDLTYFYLPHVVIVVTAVTTISLTPVVNEH